MTGGDGFVLGVDFGTSNTVAMLRRPDGRVTPLLFDGTPVLPSAVFAGSDRTLFVGRDALHHGRHRPDGLEPNPKRHIDEGTVLLSGTECTVPDLVGAVLGRVADEARRVAGHRPGTLVLSHPAGWGPVRRLTLTDAASAAGLPTPVFVPEPVAAAMYFTSVLHSSVPAGAALLVYDLGAGTFDVTVLRAGTSFEVLGSDGLDDVGGLDVDAAVVTWLRTHYTDGAWDRLTRPTSAEDRRLRLDLWAEARVAKEMLSRTAAVVMRPPLLDQEIPLTLAEFERVTRPLIDRTVRTAQGLARYCEVTAAQVLLVGGSSRIPLVATALHRAFGVPPTVTEQPETVVAEGCVFAPGVPPEADGDPVALSTVLPIGAGLTTEPFTADVGPGALPAAPLGRSVLPAMPGGPGVVPLAKTAAADAPMAPGGTDDGWPVLPPTLDTGEGPAPTPAAVDPSTLMPGDSSTPGGSSPGAGGPAAPPAAILPATALPPGAIPGARTGGSASATDLLWPPLPPTIAVHPLADGLDPTVDTARLLPVSHGTPRNSGPGRQRQRTPAQFATVAAPADHGATAPPTVRGAWPGPAAPPADPVDVPVSPDWSAPPQPTGPDEATVDLHPAPPPTRQLRVPTQPPTDEPRLPAGPPRPGRARAAAALLAVVLLLAAAAVTLIVTMPDPRDHTGARPSASPPFPSWTVRYADSLGTQRGWSAAADPSEKVECAFRNGRLEIDMRKGGIFRCPGQRDELTDFALQLDVFLLDGHACAGIWFRRGTHEDGKDSSYVLTVCRTDLVLGHHHADGDIAEFAQFPVPEIGAGIHTVVGLVVRGSEMALYLDGRFVGRHSDGAFPGGRIALGIAIPRDLGAGRVGFANVELRSP